jgi:hypothetical protein
VQRTGALYRSPRFSRRSRALLSAFKRDLRRMLASDLVRALANRCLRDIFFVRRPDVWPPSIVKTHVCASDEDASMLDAPLRADLDENPLTKGVVSSEHAMRGYKAAMDAALGPSSQALTEWIEGFR